ncbi:unnamed protein product [Hydatigera taeniaeformis]|uniref:Secreted protein n=1 Tax=Hydatigena taeniaeformis TaxID=6205 RepID=A0A0R3WQI1_HYDTA|nr:unnamed protein product [Hydatigera taeniaeformis]
MQSGALVASCLSLLISLATLKADICPRGYWPADVQSASTEKAINQYNSDRKYSLPYGPIGNTPICRFCPQISCFIMRQMTEKKDSKKESMIRRRPRPHPTHSLTTTPRTSSLENLFPVFDNANATKLSEGHEDSNVMMTCVPYSELPHPEQVITYLDCVQIGQRDLYYLFIYVPVNKENEVAPVDCIDPNFLTWIPKREKLKGIELGFPMKKLPSYLFRYYRDIMEATEQVCIDSSALINYEIDPHDLQRFDGKVLTQTVYRHRGLKRNVLPPKQPPNTAETGHKSDEEVAECPNLTPTGVGRTFSDKDCRYAASAWLDPQVNV